MNYKLVLNVHNALITLNYESNLPPLIQNKRGTSVKTSLERRIDLETYALIHVHFIAWFQGTNIRNSTRIATSISSNTRTTIRDHKSPTRRRNNTGSFDREVLSTRTLPGVLLWPPKGSHHQAKHNFLQTYCLQHQLLQSKLITDHTHTHWDTFCAKTLPYSLLCLQGYEYQTATDKCCGTCVQKSCILTTPENTTYTIEVSTPAV